jgi:hypothetical protein
MGMSELRDFLRRVDGKTITVRAVSDECDTGVHLARGGLESRLRRDLAEDFAGKVDDLASSAAGHQYLDADCGEMAVEISTGEYTDNLHPDRPLRTS